MTPQNSPRPVARALLSVSDKAGLDALIPALVRINPDVRIYSTGGTHTRLTDEGIPSTRLFKLAEQARPNVLDMLKNREIQFIVNTPSGHEARADEVQIRATAIAQKISYVTNLASAEAAIKAMRSLKDQDLTVKSIQEYHG